MNRSNLWNLIYRKDLTISSTSCCFERLKVNRERSKSRKLNRNNRNKKEILRFNIEIVDIVKVHWRYLISRFLSLFLLVYSNNKLHVHYILLYLRTNLSFYIIANAILLSNIIIVIILLWIIIAKYVHEFTTSVFFNFFSQLAIVHSFFNIYYLKRQYSFFLYYFPHDLSSNSIVCKTQACQNSKYLFNAINFAQLIKTFFASRFFRTLAITKKV